MSCGIAGAEFFRDQELVQAACHCDAAGNGGSGIAAPIEASDVVPDLLQADLIQAEVVLSEPGKIAVEIIGVGLDGTGRGAEFRCKGIEPELGQPVIRAHEILL